MTDTTQGADALDDNALFQGATVGSLEKFENPDLPTDPAPPPAPPAPPADPSKPADKPADKPAELEAHVPAMRLREEAEARRKAERELDELRGRVSAFERMQQPQRPEAPAKPDIFENPEGFVDQILARRLEQVQADYDRKVEGQSLEWAVDKFGEDKVMAAKQALEQGIYRGDPVVKGVLDRARQSHNPYGVITKWHMEREALSSMGGDINSFKQRVLDEAMKDPEFQKRVMQTIKGNGAAHEARPAAVMPKVSVSPSLSNIGAGSTDSQIVEPSDAELFRAATTAKRR
jgi:hypothetical protein